jgi:putative ABC transport system permease protein
VTNLLADLPATFHLRADGMIPFPETFNGNTGTSYGSLLGPSYIRLRAGLDPAPLTDKFTKTIHAKNPGIDIRLQPVKDVHTGSMDINFDVLNEKKMDGKYIRVFILIALAIFLIACANFINLTIAIAAYRGKEIAVKKIMGAGRGRIVFQVFAEAFLAVSLALSLAFILAGICLPFLNTIVGRELPRSVLYSWPVLGMYGVILLGTTLLAGGYPAILISAAKIDQALRTKLLFTRSRTSLRNVLVTGQFAIAVAFIIGLLVFLRQLDYIRNKDLGYSYEQVIRVPLDTRAADRLPLIRAALAPVRGVKELTTGFMNLGGKGSMFGIDYRSPEGKQEHISVNMENGGSNYIRFFRMTLVAGHGFSSDNPHDEYIINESLARLLGHADPVGKEINLAGGFKPGVIVGVVKDFNYSSLHQKIEPLLITSVDFIPVWKSQLYIRVSADGIAQTLPAITAALRPVFHGEAPQVEFMDDHFRQVYNVEEQAGALVAIIGGLAVSIACLGLLSLAAFVVVRRTKEIGIRRVLGASVTGIAASLSREFIRLVAIAFLIAAPLAGWMMDRWLRNYAYRISLGWWIFALAGVIALGIAFATVCGVSIRAARANPVNSLRSE